MKRLPLNFLNPLNPKSNQQLISLQSTLAESSIQGMRMKEMMAIKEALSGHYHRKYEENSVEIVRSNVRV